MYNSDNTKVKIIALLISIFTGISIIIAFKYGISIIDSINYLFVDTKKAMEIVNKGLNGMILWTIISTISGLIAKAMWIFA